MLIFALAIGGNDLNEEIETIKTPTGCSVARSSRLLWEQEVAGSNPATPTKGDDLILIPLFFSVFFGLDFGSLQLNRSHSSAG